MGGVLLAHSPEMLNGRNETQTRRTKFLDAGMSLTGTKSERLMRHTGLQKTK
jgi:hypothetical protein